MERYECRQCEAVRVDGVRCEGWAVRGSAPALCPVHAGLAVGAGAPLGNQNRRTHGCYARRVSEEERVELLELEGDLGVRAELALTRLMLGRLLAFMEREMSAGEAARVADAMFRGAGRVAKLAMVARELEAAEGAVESEEERIRREFAAWDPRTGPPPDWDVYLDAVAAETGWDV